MNKSIVLGGGCFWCLEAVFDKLNGVTKAQSGYAGGHVVNPGYKEVCYGTTGHAEVLKIDYNSEVISTETLLQVFFTFHDPTTLNRQGNDVGTQYRSIIFYENEEEKTLIQNYIEQEASKFWDNPIVTEISPTKIFYPAEAYHDDYYELNSAQPYCKFVIEPKVTKLRKNYQAFLKPNI